MEIVPLNPTTAIIPFSQLLCPPVFKNYGIYSMQWLQCESGSVGKAYLVVLARPVIEMDE